MRLLEYLCRYVLAAVFIFSGFVKAVDPMGSAIKFGEYAAVIDLNIPYNLLLVCGIALSTFEFGLGVALLIGVGRRLVSRLVMAMMCFFTVLTLCVAIWNPVPDCGCFGEAVSLTNWQTFYKNLVLLPMSIFLVAYRFSSSVRGMRVEIALMMGCLCLSLPVSFYALRHLPVIDFMPFKVGVNIPNAMESGGDVETTLIYKDLEKDKIVEFSLDDTTWYDDSRYEFVDTHIVQSSQADIVDFSLYHRDEDISQQVVSNKNVLLIASELFYQASQEEMSKMKNLVNQAYELDYQVYYLFSDNNNIEHVELGDHLLRAAFIDPITRKMLLRANFGAVVLDEGTIVAKWNAHDIPADLAGRLRRM